MNERSRILASLSDAEALLWWFNFDEWPPLGRIRLARLELVLAEMLDKELAPDGPIGEDRRSLAA